MQPSHNCKLSAAITATILDAVRAHLRRYRGHALILFGKQDPRLPAFLPADRHEVPNAHVKAIVLQHAGHDTWVETSPSESSNGSSRRRTSPPGPHHQPFVNRDSLDRRNEAEIGPR